MNFMKAREVTNDLNDNMQCKYLSVFLIPVLKYVLTCSFTCILFSSQVFCNKNKTILGKADTLKFPKLAETMEIIAEQGADAFYTGKIGQDLIKDIKEAGWCNCKRSQPNWGCIFEQTESENILMSHIKKKR